MTSRDLNHRGCGAGYLGVSQQFGGSAHPWRHAEPSILLDNTNQQLAGPLAIGGHIVCEQHQRVIVLRVT
jgi:hypothetical protein